MSKKRIGVYVGCFNPFHIGHRDVLNQAQQIFDEVIIGVGVNKSKINNKKYPMPEIIDGSKVIKYEGLVVDFLKELGDVTLIRGMRNNFDAISEIQFKKAIEDRIPNQKFVYLFCGRDHEHISSSLIREIDGFGGDVSDYI